jgi:hypothetical protein
VASFPWVFPYTEDVVSRTSAATDRTILRPAMKVTMVAREEQGVLALVDSGSEHTLSGMGLARVIDAAPDPDREMVLGVGGAWRKARFTEITLRLDAPEASRTERLEWEATVGFFTQWEPPWGLLLGQIGFFDHFTVTMNRISQAFALEAVDEFDRRYGVQIERGST